MPKPQETCTVIINGQEFRDWETVTATASCENATRYVVLTITEKMGTNGAVGQALSIKPKDICEVRLAGQTFLKGAIFSRQVAYDANNHTVRVTAASATQMTTRQSVPLKDGNFKGYSFQAIANKVLSPLGITLKTKNPPSGWDKPFKNINAEPGETIWNLLDRLSKYRGIRLSDDNVGNLVAHGDADPQSKAGLVEGQNILAASVTFQYPQQTGQDVVGQQPGSDTVSGDQARSSAAKVDAKGGDGGPKRSYVADIPVDGDDAAKASAASQLVALSIQTEAQIVVQGWLTGDGKLPEIRDFVDIDSPSLPIKQKMQIAELAFTQDNNGGTRTTYVVRKWLSQNGDVDASGTEQSAAQEATTNNVSPGTPKVETLGSGSVHNS